MKFSLESVFALLQDRTKNKENNLEPKKQTEDNKDSSLKSIN